MYQTPLPERQRLAAIHKRRYWQDADYRLRSINRARAKQGLPPRESVGEILSPEQKAAQARQQIRSQQRDESGRLV